ncbi:sensor histidine kinase [Candidatus Zixiibacteriota bacterium]
MLINRKEDINQIFKNFESLKEFEAIRIYDKKGTIIFTTIPEEKGLKTTINSEACQVCHSHSQTEPLKALMTKQRQRITITPDNKTVLGLINPIENEESCVRADCHVSPEKQAILGVLDVQMSLDIVYLALDRSQRNTIIASGFLIFIVLAAVGFLIYKQIRVPIKKLTNGTIAIANGNLDYSIPVKRKDEIGELAGSFNKMVNELKKARVELTNWSDTLQEKVKKKTKELQQIQNHLLYVEKMASLGKLAATVAHELNNPLGGILTYTRLTRRRLDNRELTEELINSIKSDLKIVDDETIRCGNIVKNLLLFSKLDVGTFTFCDIIKIINQCQQLIQHHLELNNINLITEFQDKSIYTLCDKNQLQQALLAITINAIEAMNDGGTLKISANLSSSMISINIKDDGCGIAPEIVPYIFEPFYTQKKTGKGVGLGLSIAYGIIEAHKGKIEVDSTVGVGSDFIITIPKRSEKDIKEAETQITDKNIKGE